jgi:uncharacterized membrane protein
MAERIAHTAQDDTPLATAAAHPDASALRGSPGAHSAGVVIGRTVYINRPREALYAVWRDFSNLQDFMENVISVKVLDATRSHWTIAAPGGRTLEWDSQVTEDVPGERIAWNSVEGASVRNSGMVEFRESPTGRGTFVTITLAYDSPAGNLGRLKARLYEREPHIPPRQGGRIAAY